MKAHSPGVGGLHAWKPRHANGLLKEYVVIIIMTPHQYKVICEKVATPFTL